MTKKELINELHQNGEFWANESYKKEYLESYLKGIKKAKKMPIEELAKFIGFEG